MSVIAELSNTDPEANIPLADITAAFVAAYGTDYEKPITNRWIGGILRRLGFTLYKSHGLFVLRGGQRQRLIALAARYGVGDSAGTNCAA